MGLRPLIFLPALIFFCLDALGQDSTFFLSFDAGVQSVGCEAVKKDYLRGDNPPPTLFASKITSELSMWFAGVKIEKKDAQERFGLATGIRFTGLQSRIYRSGNPQFFFLLHRQTGTTTEYLSVSELRELSYYLGIPLEFHIYTNRRRRNRWFFMGGGEWNLHLRTKKEVQFHDPAMHIYESGVKEILGNPGSWYASFYIGAGLILGKERPRFTVGLTSPLAITKTASSLNVPTAGVGLQVQYLISLTNSRK